jgi:hypothetical protein
VADVNNIDYVDEPIYEIPFPEIEYQLNNIEEENPGGGQEPGFNPGFN